MYDISIVVPVRDEEKNLNELISRISRTLQGMRKSFEVIFVTDVNTDNTVRVLEEFARGEPNIKALKLSSSFGQHVAVMAGLEHCSGDYVVIMDGDLQDCPEDIELLHNKIIEGYDIVYATKEKKNDDLFRNVSSRAFNGLMGLLSDTRIDTNTSMFRIISNKALQEVLKFREFEPSLTYIFGYINLPHTTVKVQSGSRLAGETKYGLMRLINLAVSSMVSFSRKPLRMISALGLAMSLISFLYLAIVIYQYFASEIEIMGWTTITVIITFIGGIQLLSLGIIGEYIGRIYIQTKNRPLYITEREFGEFRPEHHASTATASLGEKPD